uniref:Uncharacterized protein n=1 Tax=Desulfovibrio sp. U5L TaxID=596152 RepID=I2Q6L9_9BACT
MEFVKAHPWLWLPLFSVILLTAEPLQVQAEGGQQHQAHQAASALSSQGAPLPHESGQAAFAAIQEIVVLLESDPGTDWSKVRILALREHLVDMNELMVRAAIEEKHLDNGMEAVATGEGRTLEAIRRMVTAHAAMLDGYRGWHVQAEDIEKGMRLRVTSETAGEAAHIKGLGFFGVMATGAHHQQHHLMIAKGEMMH